MDAFQFHPVIARWFEEKFGSPTEPQQGGWPAIQSGAHTLIAAPTGSGKTLAAFFASLDRLFRQGLAAELKDETQVVYVSPLKALSNDIHKNLEEPLVGIRAALLADAGKDVQVRAEVRTGDTPASKRQALAKRPPHILVTTPESLYLLLTSGSGRKLLSTTRTLIVDEIHAVVGNRRGSHLALSMERLAALTQKPLQRIGLSATQKPIELVASFLVGGPAERLIHHSPDARCTIIDTGHKRALDLAIEVPGSPLEAVMSNEVWAEVYTRLGELIEAHRTTLVFVNTRRLAERVTHHLCEGLGKDKVTSHHGSLSAKLRLEAEDRLKRGELKALVATASLELGIDIGSVDLVCQLGSTRSIATLLQRAGRASHHREGLPRARLFPLTRDELVECVALLKSVHRGDLDALEIPEKPLDVLAQQIVAGAATEDWEEQKLFDLFRSAWPYRNLTREEFDATVRMLAEGFSTKRGRRAALIHHDAINHRIRARRGAGLIALTSGGAIPDTADYRVVVEPHETFIGTVNEDFAVESLAGDIFQLGNASWKILRINSGQVRVEDAHGQPPGIPFWLGEAPGRTNELSRAVSNLRNEMEEFLHSRNGNTEALNCNNPSQSAQPLRLVTPAATPLDEPGVPEPAQRQLIDYFSDADRSLGVIPSQRKIVLERFFDESGGMQLVIHSPFGSRVNRAWGLALRKRFCRSFNFELQAAATDDAIVLSLGTQHSFPLEEVFHYLHSNTVRELLVQALLDAPMFPIRWRWNATRSLALPRHRGGRRIPPPLLRMESENLLAAVFPDQLACLENIVGDRQIPDHPLVHQTIEDCLTEAMDIDGLIGVLKQIEQGKVECIARDLPEPSTMAHEILNARPYAFLDNAPLEERRTQAVYTRRAGETRSDELGILDPAAIEKVREEAWPRAANTDELHDALLLSWALTDAEIRQVVGVARRETSISSPQPSPPKDEGETEADLWLRTLLAEKRINRLRSCPPFWVAAERFSMVSGIYNGAGTSDRADAVRELLRGRMEIIGPTTRSALARFFNLPEDETETALIALEGEGFILRGKFNHGAAETEWCDRRLLARIHRLTINRLRAEIQPVSIAHFQRFLVAWQRAEPERCAEGPEGAHAILELLDGYQLAAAAWEPQVLALRVKDYDPQWLDQLCFTGRIGWGRLTAPQSSNGRPSMPVKSSPVSLFLRENLLNWLTLSNPEKPADQSPAKNGGSPWSNETALVLETLRTGGALFFHELLSRTRFLPSRLEQSLAELVATGSVTSDSFEGLRALLVPQEKRIPFADPERPRRHKAITSLEFAGRWVLLAPSELERKESDEAGTQKQRESGRDVATETFARVLLRRYGVMFRRLLDRESLPVTWYDLTRVYRRLEARGEIRGGHFVSGISGEQFALPEAIGLLRSIRKEPAASQFLAICGADPLNLCGILTPGPRVTAVTGNRILLRDGVPIAALEGGQIVFLEPDAGAQSGEVEKTLKVGKMAASLRRYYA